jgi:predicted ATP-dependent endonuclease of OLD family
MKITSLKIHGVGAIADATIEINRPLLVFYGEVKMGKSTLLNAVRWVCGAPWPADIIKHGEKEASIELEFDGGVISRSWYRTKATAETPSETKARPIIYVKAGKPVQSPAAALKALLNPFLLDQDFLRNKSELERKQYFTEQFAVDTSALDTELFEAGRKATALRSKLTGYGDIDLTKVETVDIAGVQAELAKHQGKLNDWGKRRSERAQAHQTEAQSRERSNAAVRQRNAAVDRKQTTFDGLVAEIARLRAEILKHEETLRECREWIVANPKEEEVAPPVPPRDEPPPAEPDTSALAQKLQDAAAQNVRAEQYRKNLARDEERKADETALKALEDQQRKLRKDKLAALATVNETCGIPGLTFEEDGNFAFEGTAAGMLSTSQIMRLSSLLSATYPEGLSIELLDRGESLGRSIFDYVKHAEAKRISVLATVVGSKPANVPANVGVFVVSDGVVMPDESK